MTSTDQTEFIRRMPKVELHVHIEVTLEPELKFALAERNRIALPYADVAAMREAYTFDDLSSFLACYYEGMGVLQTAEDFADLARAYLRRANEQHVRYALDDAVGLSQAEVVQLQRNAIEIAWLPVAAKEELTAELHDFATSAP